MRMGCVSSCDKHIPSKIPPERQIRDIILKIDGLLLDERNKASTQADERNQRCRHDLILIIEIATLCGSESLEPQILKDVRQLVTKMKRCDNHLCKAVEAVEETLLTLLTEKTKSSPPIPPRDSTGPEIKSTKTSTKNRGLSIDTDGSAATLRSLDGSVDSVDEEYGFFDIEAKS